jgi:cation:H+ antiporter
MQSAVLVTLLPLILIALLKPAFAVFGVHPLSAVIAAGIFLGFRAIHETGKHPSWRARTDEDGNGGGSDGKSGQRKSQGGQGGQDSQSKSKGSQGNQSKSEDGQGRQGKSKGRLFARYGVYVVAVGVSGYLISGSTSAIISQTGLSPVVAGLTLTAVVTSLPELVTAVSSVRRGAVAIGDIVGGTPSTR